MNNNLLNIKQASEYLNVTQETLRVWDRNGKLRSIKTAGGHRRYQKEILDKFIGIQTNNEEYNNITATYSRVSSHEQKQKGDLDRQSQRLSEYCAKKKLNVGYIIKDIGSGLSDTRNGFIKLSNLVIDKKITTIVIEHKDRLTRFQYNFIVKMYESYGVKVICISQPDDEGDKEFINDLMMIITSFSGRLYGSRSVKRRKELKLNNNNIK